MTEKKAELVTQILEYWKAPLVFDAEYYRAKFKAKYQLEHDKWKIEFYVEKKRKGHERLLDSANKIATLAENIYK